MPDAVCRGGRKRYSADLLLAERPGAGYTGGAAARRRVGGNGGFQDRRGTSRIGRVGGCRADSYLQRVAEPESGVPGHVWMDSLRNRGGAAASVRVGSRRGKLDAEDRRRQPQGHSRLSLRDEKYRAARGRLYELPEAERHPGRTGSDHVEPGSTVPAGIHRGYAGRRHLEHGGLCRSGAESGAFILAERKRLSPGGTVCVGRRRNGHRHGQRFHSEYRRVQRLPICSLLPAGYGRFTGGKPERGQPSLRRGEDVPVLRGNQRREWH